MFLALGLRKLTRDIVFKNAPIIVFLTAAAVMPFVWIFITAGHACENYWYTYKEFAISSFALLSLCIYLKDLICDEVK